jgi:hypothetical protein
LKARGENESSKKQQKVSERLSSGRNDINNFGRGNRASSP